MYTTETANSLFCWINCDGHTAGSAALNAERTQLRFNYPFASADFYDVNPRRCAADYAQTVVYALNRRRYVR